MELNDYNACAIIQSQWSGGFAFMVRPIYSAAKLALTGTVLIALFCFLSAQNPDQRANATDVKPADSTSLKDDVAGKKAVDEQSLSKFRLPDCVSPLEYDLSFKPDLSKFDFSGHESVKIRLTRTCAEIVLNALELEVTKAELLELDGKSALRTELDVMLDAETQKIRFLPRSRKSIAAGTYLLNCDFKGILNTELRGFYRTAYEDDEKAKHFIAVTQMEPTDARRMFPCFDEPAYKAVFRISATIDGNHTAISNAPVLREEALEGGKKKIVFEATPKMSSYLLALVVGDLKCTGQVLAGNVPLRVWAVSGKEHLGKYALSEAGKILDFESKYFGIPYLGKKMDLIAVPEFAAGAMENIGAVTFHDSNLLFDDKTGSSFQKQDIFGTIAHEFAHQWFGDLVTMAWWDDLWLNESFATWFSVKVEEALHPEWRSKSESVYGRYGAMGTDSLKSTRAIHAKVMDPSQAIEMFDGITYSKGAAVLRMLETYVGEEVFQRGIRAYMEKHQFANAVAEEFWESIAQEAGGKPVAAIMRGFVMQPGYPQLNIKISPDSRKLALTQYRQLKLGQNKKDESLWQVPVVLKVLAASEASAPSGNYMSKLLSGRSQEFDISANRGKAVLVNAGAAGYYKTCYEPEYLKKILALFSLLSTEEKIALIADCSALVLPGDLPIEDFYAFLRLLKDESDPMILSDLVSIASGPQEYMRESPYKEAYQKWLRHILIPLKAKLDGWNQKPTDSQQTKSLRLQVLSMLGTHGQDRRTIGEAFFMFGKYCKNRSSINPDQVQTVLAIVAFNGGAGEYDELMRLWKTASNPADEDRALSCLDSFHEPALARRTIAFAMGKEVKKQDGIGLIVGLAHNRYTRELGWSYIKENWTRIMNHFPKESLASLAGLPLAFDTPEKEKEMIAWFGSHPVPYSKSRLARSLERMHINILFRQRYAERLRKFVNAQVFNH